MIWTIYHTSSNKKVGFCVLFNPSYEFAILHSNHLVDPTIGTHYA